MKSYTFHATDEVDSHLKSIQALGKGKVSQWILTACRQRIERDKQSAPIIFTEPKQSTRLLKAAEVMPLTGHTDPSAFWQFVHRNGVPFVKLGKRTFRFEESALRAYLDSRSVGRKAKGAA